MQLLTSKSIVIKIGSSLLVDPENLSVNRKWLVSLIDDIIFLRSKGIQVILVSSGAIALGKIALQLHTKHLSVDVKQALAAVGQIELSQIYQSLLKEHNTLAAQVLLTLEDTEDRKRYINCRHTLKRLLDLNIVPIINENDSVATSEIRYGDNDRLAARVAAMINADTLILLSDIDGLYTDDPHINKNATLIPEVKQLDTKVFDLAKDSHSDYGSGGMVTKLEAAKLAMNSGCTMLITKGKTLNPIQNFLKTERGTWFVASQTSETAKKNWLRDHLNAQGQIMVDRGATSALNNGSSLLPAGIKAVRGSFKKGAAVDVLDMDNNIIARGLSNYPADEIHKIMGQHSKQIHEILNYDGLAEVIHRDNLVLLK